jgi:hypothetical protein
MTCSSSKSVENNTLFTHGHHKQRPEVDNVSYQFDGDSSEQTALMARSSAPDRGESETCAISTFVMAEFRAVVAK